MIYAVICAGGIGTRMKSDVPKQFLPINGEPIIIKTVKAFCGYADHIYIGITSGWESYTRELLDKYGVQNVIVVAGGTNRMATILNVKEQIMKEQKVMDDDIILTHDAVRPFVSENIISENIKKCMEMDACGTFVNAVDTIAVSKDGKFLESIPCRNQMYNVQTPQTVKWKVLCSLLDKFKDRYDEFTDLCGMMLAGGVNVGMVDGQYSNIKITNPEDLKSFKE